MATKRAQSADKLAPAGGEDFKRIRGIGPAVESRLHAAGILSYAQLSATSPEELAAHLTGLAGLSAERIEQQGWIGQAAALAAAARPERAAPLARKNYAAFTVELQLSEEQTVRWTNLWDLQSEQKESWPGWDGSHLEAAIAAKAGFTLPRATEPPQSDAAAERPPLGERPPQPEPRPYLIRKIEALLNEGRWPASFVHSDQPYSIAVTLEVEQESRHAGTEVIVSVSARDLSSGQRHALGVAQVPLVVERPSAITLSGRPLRPGIYRLEARATDGVRPQEQGTLFRGPLLQVL